MSEMSDYLWHYLTAYNFSVFTYIYMLLLYMLLATFYNGHDVICSIPFHLPWNAYSTGLCLYCVRLLLSYYPSFLRLLS